LVREFKDAQFQPLMDKLAKDGLTPDELALFAYAKHAPSRNAHIASINPAMPDGGSGMTDQEAQDILHAFRAEGKYAKLEAAQQEVTGWTQQIRDMMLDYGLITQEKYDALNSMWQDYVPLKTELLEDEIDTSPISFGGKGFDIRARMTMRALGRQSRAGDILENIVAEFERVVDIGEKNTVAQTFLQFVVDNPNKDLYEIDVVTTKLAYDKASGKVTRKSAPLDGKNTVMVKVKGRDVFITVKDDLLAQAIMSDNLLQPGAYSMALVAPVTNLMRNTLTRYNPAFAFVNAARDLGFSAAAIKDELGNEGMKRLLKNYANAHKVAAMFTWSREAYDKLPPAERRMFDEYRAAGGMTGGFFKKDVAEIRGDIRDIMLHNGAAPKDWKERVKVTKVGITLGGKRYATGPYDIAAKTLRLLEFAGSMSESGVRFAAYKAAREMGKSPAEAARIAKDLTTNFDRKGELGRVLNTYFVFYNAAVQGAERTVRMVKNPKMRA
jgi:hypothetical protein